MSRFTLTIDLPDDYDESAAAEFPNDVALEVLNGVFHDCEIEYASLLPTGHGRHRLDADFVDGDRHRLEDVRQQGIVMLVAVDCIDMSDHDPAPRKRAWAIDESPQTTHDVDVAVVPSDRQVRRGRVALVTSRLPRRRRFGQHHRAYP